MVSSIFLCILLSSQVLESQIGFDTVYVLPLLISQLIPLSVSSILESQFGFDCGVVVSLFEDANKNSIQEKEITELRDYGARRLRSNSGPIWSRANVVDYSPEN